MKKIVISEVIRLSDTKESDEIICVTQSSFIRTLMRMCRVRSVHEIITKTPHTFMYIKYRSIEIRRSSIRVGEDRIKDLFDSEEPLFVYLQKIDDWNYFVNTFDFKSEQYEVIPLRSNLSYEMNMESIIGMLEFLEMSMIRHFSPIESTPRSIYEPTLFIHGGGQHGSVLIGATTAALEKLGSRSFTRFAGASFGAAIAATLALRNKTLYEALNDCCQSMKLYETRYSEKIVNGDVALQFVQGFLTPEENEKTLGELNLNVDILVTRIPDLSMYVLNAQTAPNVKLKDALKASMGLPVVIGSTTLETAEGTMCFIDGNFYAETYLKSLKHPGSTEVKLAGSTGIVDLSSLLEENSIGKRVFDFAQHVFAFFIEKFERQYLPYQVITDVRDKDQPVFGGAVGSTTWHLLNYEFGFKEARIYSQAFHGRFDRDASNT